MSSRTSVLKYIIKTAGKPTPNALTSKEEIPVVHFSQTF
jgi:hypothetical protein